MSDSPFVTAKEIAATLGPTYGLTAMQIRWDVKHGYLPGRINHRNKVEILRDGPVSWNAYLEGTWIPPEPGSHKKLQAEKPVNKPVGIVSLNSKAS